MNDFIKEGEYNIYFDCIIKYVNKEYKVHRFILYKNKYFKTYLSYNNWKCIKKEGTTVLKIDNSLFLDEHNTCSNSINLFLNYLYMDVSDITLNMFFELRDEVNL